MRTSSRIAYIKPHYKGKNKRFALHFAISAEQDCNNKKFFIKKECR